MAHLIRVGLATLLAALLTWSDSTFAQPVDPHDTAVPTLIATEANLVPAAAQVALAFPGMTGPLALNPDPAAIDVGPIADIYVTGVASAVAHCDAYVSENAYSSVARADFVRAIDHPAGSGFGLSTDKRSQLRITVESGIVF